jgi:hypothetical protein
MPADALTPIVYILDCGPAVKKRHSICSRLFFFVKVAVVDHDKQPSVKDLLGMQSKFCFVPTGGFGEIDQPQLSCFQCEPYRARNHDECAFGFVTGRGEANGMETHRMVTEDGKGLIEHKQRQDAIKERLRKKTKKGRWVMHQSE